MQYLCMISILALMPPDFSNYFTAVNKRHRYNTRLASRSSYTLPPIRTNYGKFSIKFQGAKIWNSLSVETKSLHRLAFKKTLKREIIQFYWYTLIFFNYMEESVLLGTKPLVDSIRHFIRDPSGVFSVCHLCECRFVQ